MPKVDYPTRKVEPFHITKRNQKQAIPQTRIGKAKIEALVLRIRDLENEIARREKEKKEKAQLVPSQGIKPGLIKVVMTSSRPGKSVIGNQVVWLRSPTLSSFIGRMQYQLLDEKEIFDTLVYKLNEARKELEILARDPVYRKYILLYKMRME